ncbi:MAG TPA: anti-sigma factor [Thermohalobaculum sp.]|nr:anti-sigma factor [Thermohalobaculum sp.]
MNRDRNSSLILRLQRLLARPGDRDVRARGMPDLRVLAPLLECLAPAPPPPGLLTRIEQQIAAERRRPPRQRFAVAAAFGASAGIAAVLALAPLADNRAWEAPVPLTVIDGADRVAMLDARMLAHGRYLRIDHFGLLGPTDRALELWLLRDGTGDGIARPESLGLLSQRGGATVLPLARAVTAGDLLAVSEEPPGGAPGPGPSGPVILTARVGGGS